ncbi:MAG: polynucleotide adenylyltransferase PcnB [Pseudoxanthomonas sp.]|nr:polynucleotide adenylyltransferase PcnB [Pseudoxanthomonas sp.]
MRGRDERERPAAPRPRRQPPALAPGAVVIPRDQHGISRKDISNNALRVLYRLDEAGFQAYLVGGAVRDLLLGGRPKDFDVATDASPDQVRQLFRNCRLIGRRFRLAHIHFGQEIIEVATFRGTGDDGDRKLDNGRLLRDNIYGSLEEDIFRRDFTINALYYNIADFSLRDDAGGVADIGARRLRLIGEPEARFREDPVRMLRAVRFAAKLGFELEPAMARALPMLAYLLAEVPPPRLFDETTKLFLMGHAERSFDLLREHGLLPALMPQVADELAADADGRYLSFVREALRGSDQRVAEGRPLTSGFMLAVLLWPFAQRTHAAMVAKGTEANLAWQHAADAVVMPFCQRVAVPRRISLVSQEIWTLQGWLTQRTRRRVVRLLAHPRFRAAWDFLVLRASVEPALSELVDWWRQTQSLDEASLEGHLGQVPGDGPAGDGQGKRRRRRGGRRRGGGQGGAGGGD